MDGQHHPNGAGHKRRRRARETSATNKVEPVLIAARRPNAPPVRLQKRLIAASASPRPSSRNAFVASSGELLGPESKSAVEPKLEGAEPSLIQRRAARIVQVLPTDIDANERERQRLIDRLLSSEGRVAISRVANEMRSAGFEFPMNQPVQLQLLELFDEKQAYQAINALQSLLQTEEPIKRPVFEQRLRRLEEFAEDPTTRAAAAELRRVVRG